MLSGNKHSDNKDLHQESRLKMIDTYTLEQCKKDKDIRQLKIKSLEHAIEQSEAMITESQMNGEALIFLRKKVADSKQDLEVLYLMNLQDK